MTKTTTPNTTEHFEDIDWLLARYIGLLTYLNTPTFAYHGAIREELMHAVLFAYKRKRANFEVTQVESRKLLEALLVFKDSRPIGITFGAPK